jgi:hypothetical protein
LKESKYLYSFYGFSKINHLQWKDVAMTSGGDL